MLENTLKTEFTPATNLKGDVTGANWSFLLPSLELGQVLCIGVPRVTTLRALARLGRRLVVHCSSPSDRELVRAVAAEHGLTNVELGSRDHDRFDLSDGSVDLLVVVERRQLRRLSRQSQLQLEYARILSAKGRVYGEFRGPSSLMFGRRGADRLEAALGPRQHLWLTPLAGEMHTAVPASDHRSIQFFLDRKLYSSSVNLETCARLWPILNRLRRSRQRQQLAASGSGKDKQPSTRRSKRGGWKARAAQWGRAALTGCQRLEEKLYRHAGVDRMFRRQGTFIGPTISAGPPDYLVSIARQAGIDVEALRWGLAAGGEFSSRKLLFFLFDRRTDLLRYIVKMTRTPVQNSRLENECRALSWLNERGIGDSESLPRVAFSGRHGGLALVAETVIHGVPFDERTSWDANCRFARQALDWLVELSVQTADADKADPAQFAATLDRLRQRFVDIYSVPRDEQRFLESQIAAVAATQEPIPAVFQHGDPGRWNLFVTDTGKVAFLDWEAAESAGMPLWDLFYLIRSFSVGVSQKNGIRVPLSGIEQGWFDDTPVGRLAVEVTRRYCRDVKLPCHLVEPLFHTCWMHRALKEAMRLKKSELNSGHYINLLRSGIRNRQAPTLRSLFSLTGDGDWPGPAHLVGSADGQR